MKVKFVDFSTVYSPISGGLLYALDDDGQLWVFSNSHWMQITNPDKE